MLEDTRLLALFFLVSGQDLPLAGPLRAAPRAQGGLYLRALSVLELPRSRTVLEGLEYVVRTEALPVHADWCHVVARHGHAQALGG